MVGQNNPTQIAQLVCNSSTRAPGKEAMARFERKAKPPHCSNAIGLRLGKERCRSKSEMQSHGGVGSCGPSKNHRDMIGPSSSCCFLPPRAWPPGKLDTMPPLERYSYWVRRSWRRVSLHFCTETFRLQNSARFAGEGRRVTPGGRLRFLCLIFFAVF